MEIYLVQNLINGQWYIGKTSLTTSQRFARHLRQAKQGTGWFLHRAMRKYGPENFCATPLLIGLESDSSLSFSEICAIALMRCFSSYTSYNLTDGGDGTIGLRRTKESKKRMSSIAKQCGIYQNFHHGNFGTPLHYMRIAQSNTGRKMTDTARANSRTSHLGKSNGKWTSERRARFAATCTSRPNYRGRKVTAGG